MYVIAPQIRADIVISQIFNRFILFAPIWYWAHRDPTERGWEATLFTHRQAKGARPSHSTHTHTCDSRNYSLVVVQVDSCEQGVYIVLLTVVEILIFFFFKVCAKIY